MKTYEIKPTNGRKSFYGKATVTECNGVMILKSYSTDVAKIDANGKFSRLWSGYSATALNHVNAFRIMNGMEAINKSAWGKLPVEKYSPLVDMVIDHNRNYVA